MSMERYPLDEIIWHLDDLLENFEGLVWITKAGDVARLKTKFWEIVDKECETDMSISCQSLAVLKAGDAIKLKKAGMPDGNSGNSVVAIFDKMVEEVEGRLGELAVTCCADQPG